MLALLYVYSLLTYAVMCVLGSGDRDVGSGFRGGRSRGRGWARGGGYYNGRGNSFILMLLTAGIKTR